MYTLRGYQQKVADMTVEFLKTTRYKNGINILPTGSGKSLIIAEIATQLKEPLIIFQPTREILEQNFSKYITYGFNNASVYSASFNSKKINEVTFATIGSVCKKPEHFKNFKYILIDECHLVNPLQGMYKDFLENIEGRFIGFTATPYRLAHNSWGSVLRFLTRTKKKIFHKVISYVQTNDLIKNGYMCPLDYVRIGGFQTIALEINSTGNDYTDRSVKQYYDEIRFEQKLSSIVAKCAEARKHTLVFTRFIDEAMHLKRTIPNVECVSSKTPKKERSNIIRSFREGKTKVVANVGILTLGFDFPELETIVLARPTRSLSLYYQMIGRGTRIHKNKEKCYIIDLCQNMPLFGRIEEMRMTKDEKGLWCIKSGNKQLTNIYY